LCVLVFLCSDGADAATLLRPRFATPGYGSLLLVLYRVFDLPEELRTRLRAKRAKAAATTAEVVQTATADVGKGPTESLPHTRKGVVLPEGHLPVGGETLASLGHGYYIYGLPGESIPLGHGPSGVIQWLCSFPGRCKISVCRAAILTAWSQNRCTPECEYEASLRMSVAERPAGQFVLAGF
jgi:hypothetical protein